MKDKNSSTASCSIGFVDLLAIAFIVLKLLGKITWSWWWVLSPIWISAILVIILIVIYIIADLIA